MKLLLLLVLALAVATVFVMSEDSDKSSAEVVTGSCGDNVEYSFDQETGTLTITWTGNSSDTSTQDSGIATSIPSSTKKGMTDYSSHSSPCYQTFISQIKTAIIGNGVPNIGSYAFEGCTALTSITIPDSVTCIGAHAFEGCISLTSITLPDSVEVLGRQQYDITFDMPVYGGTKESLVFDGCTSLVSIIVDEDNDIFSSEEGVLFNKDKTELIFCPAGKTGTYSIPPTVTAIRSYAFISCSGLNSVTISNSVITIGDYAFTNCTGLTSLNIPDSVTTIGASAFQSCSNLISISIPKSVNKFGDRTVESTAVVYWSFYPKEFLVFDGCKSLVSIEVAEDNVLYSSEGGVLFNKEKTKLILYPFGKTGAYIIPNTVTVIGEYAFYTCRSLSSVILGDSVTTVGVFAFVGCDNLKSLSFPDSIQTIGYNSTGIGYAFPEAVFGVTFCDTDGCSELEVKSENLAGCTFECINGKFVKLEKQCPHLIFQTTNGDLVSIVYYIDGDTSIEEPAHSTTYGYTYTWSAYVLDGSNQTVTEIRTPIDYTVSFDANGGSGTIDLITANVETFAVPECTFTAPDHKHFVGWSLSANGDVIDFNDYQLKTATFFAIWVWDQYKVFYKVDSKTVFTDTFDYGKTVSVRATYDKKGYSVEKWSTADTTVSEDGTFVMGASDVTFSTTTTVNKYAYEIRFVNGSGVALVDKISGEKEYRTSVDYTVPDVYGYDTPEKQILTITDDADDNVLTYTYVPVKFTVTYTADGILKESESFDYDTIQKTIALPEKTGHTYSAWAADGITVSEDGSFTVSGNIAFTSISTPNQYNVVFVSNGFEYYRYMPTYGSVIILPENPVRDADAQYTYVFGKWNGYVAGMTVTGDVVFSADFDKTPRTYKVVFSGYDGSEISSAVLGYGAEIAVPKDPFRLSDAKYDYVFAGWDGYVTGMKVTENVTFTASFTSTIRSYDIVFLNYDGSVVSSASKEYGSFVTMPEQPSRPSDSKYEYEFAGWNGYVKDMTVTGDVTFTASYTSKIRSYSVVFHNYDGSEVYSATLEYGSTIVVPKDPSRDADTMYSYTFSRWNGYVDGMKVTCDNIFTALYTAKSNTESTYVVGYQTVSTTVTSSQLALISSNAHSDSTTKMTVLAGDSSVTFDSNALKTLKQEDADLKITLLSDDSLSNPIKNIVGNNPVYDITFGSNITFGNGTATVTFPYILEDGKDPANLSVYYVKDDGSYDIIPCTYSENGVTFDTNHFSIYAIIYTEPSEEGFPMMIVIAVVIILAIAGAGMVIMKKRKC